ncbi:MAG: response regulator transcription factor [Beutenbergiaceae bacterium]
MRVLLVDDERAFTRPLQRGLVAEGFVVDVAHDGEQGLNLARFGDYDIIVLDVMLPRRNGYDVITALREEQVWTPVLMLSAKDGEYDVADGLDLGADDYLVKPVPFVVLVAKMRAMTRRQAVPRPAVAQAGAIRLDPSDRSVTVAGETVELTVREFALLEYLMRHADRVVSKLELLEHVWDGEDPNVVEQYVGYLRRKLGRSSIMTVRGAGYQIAGAAGG